MTLLIGDFSITADQRAEVNELLLDIERANPTPSPARSKLLNGVWNLKYAGALSAGVLDSPTRELALSVREANVLIHLPPYPSLHAQLPLRLHNCGACRASLASC